jgi:hypothetical protein
VTPKNFGAVVSISIFLFSTTRARLSRRSGITGNRLSPLGESGFGNHDGATGYRFCLAIGTRSSRKRDHRNGPDTPIPASKSCSALLFRELFRSPTRGGPTAALYCRRHPPLLHSLRVLRYLRVLRAKVSFPQRQRSLGDPISCRIDRQSRRPTTTSGDAAAFLRR